MAEYFAFQAALCFSIAHIFVRRGLVNSNALTGSFISLGTSAAILWLLALALVPLSALRTPAVGYFIAGGVFAPAIGQTLGYIGMERIGVARSAPIVNTSPIFSSLFAVFFLGEVWTGQNMLGTGLVIAGIIVLSSSKPAEGDPSTRTPAMAGVRSLEIPPESRGVVLSERSESKGHGSGAPGLPGGLHWRKKDIIYPLLGAMAFGVSTTLRKSGLTTVPLPLLAAAVTVGTAFVVLLLIIQVRGGRRELKFHRQSNGWLFGAALANTGAILSFFSALNLGTIVRIEPLVACNPLLTILWTGIFLRQIERLSARIIAGALVTVAGTILVVTVK